MMRETEFLIYICAFFVLTINHKRIKTPHNEDQNVSETNLSPLFYIKSHFFGSRAMCQMGQNPLIRSDTSLSIMLLLARLWKESPSQFKHVLASLPGMDPLP